MEVKASLVLHLLHFVLVVFQGKYQLEVKASCLEELDAQEVLEQLEEGRPPTAVTGIFKDDKFDNL